MESQDEADRLLAQLRADETQRQLTQAGLRPGDRALDAGCGPGAVTFEMAKIVGPSGSVVGIDASAERLARAKAAANIEYQQHDIHHTGFPASSFDFVFSQFVFQYLPDRRGALMELLRVTRPGGRVAVADADGAGVWAWPQPAELETGMQLFLSALAPTGFDLYTGRKMFAAFRAAGLDHISVTLQPLYVVAGVADPPMIEDWNIRFNALSRLMVPAFGGEAAYRAFTESYLALLRSPDALKYGVVLTTVGQKALSR